MTDAIRNVVIRAKWETVRGGLETPDIQQAAKAHEEVAKAVERTAKAQREVSKAAKEFFTGQVPEDFQKYFKSLADAKKYAWETAGPSGERMLKEDPKFFRDMRAIDRENGVVDSSMEQFGRKTKRSFTEGLEGVTNFGRGLALVASTGSEDTRKLLESIVKIQGAIDMLRGGVQIARFGSVVGGLTAVVTAGVGAWMLYSQQVEKAKKTLESLADAHHKVSQAETKAMQEREANAAKATAAQTDANSSATERKKAQDAELAGIRERRAEAEKSYVVDEEARRKAAEDADKARSNASPLPGGMLEGMLQGNTPQSSLDASYEKERLNKLADKRAASAAEFAERERANLEQRQADAQRERDILTQQRDARIKQARDLEASQLEALRRGDETMTPREKAQREMAEFRYDRQREQIENAMNLGGGMMPFGAAAAVSGFTFQGAREEGIHQAANKSVQAINDDATKSIKAAESLLSNLRSVMTTLNEEVAKMKAAHPN